MSLKDPCVGAEAPAGAAVGKQWSLVEVDPQGSPSLGLPLGGGRQQDTSPSSLCVPAVRRQATWSQSSMCPHHDVPPCQKSRSSEVNKPWMKSLKP